MIKLPYEFDVIRKQQVMFTYLSHEYYNRSKYALKVWSKEDKNNIFLHQFPKRFTIYTPHLSDRGITLQELRSINCVAKFDTTLFRTLFARSFKGKLIINDYYNVPVRFSFLSDAIR